MKNLLRTYRLLFWVLLIFVTSCYPEEKLDEPVRRSDIELTELDRYIENNFTEPYGMAIRYRYVDRYVNPGQRVTPPKEEVVCPMLDFIETFWIEPYLEVHAGEEFFVNHVPAEIVFLGGLIYNEDGTVTLGTADAGAQITFTNVNDIDPSDLEWRALQLQTVYHEFAHTVHQRYKLPTAYETISPTGYTSAGSWFNLTDEESLERGFVSPYGTSSPNEDFAELVAFYLFDENFHANFTEQEDECNTAACEAANEGKKLIAEKLSAIQSHYQKVTGINLEELRAVIQSKL